MRRGQVGDSKPLEELVDRSPTGAEGDVPAHAEVREQGVVLEDEADTTLFGRQRDVSFRVEPSFAVERDASTRRLEETGDDAQGRRLARTGRPDERDGARYVEREL